MNDFTNAALNAPPNYALDAAPPPTNRNKMFFGADGLRAG